jgi:hypothetical protein
VDTVIWPAHKADCESRKQDPLKARSVVNIDYYPVHVSHAFLAWVKERYELPLCLYCPDAPSKAQVTDCLLNKPFKNYYVQAHTQPMMKEVRKHVASGHVLMTMNFNLKATAARGPALSWLVGSYAKLGALDHKPALQAIGYGRCWDDKVFIQAAMERAGDFLPVDDLAVLEGDLTPIDDEEELVAGLL